MESFNVNFILARRPVMQALLHVIKKTVFSFNYHAAGAHRELQYRVMVLHSVLFGSAKVVQKKRVYCKSCT